MQTSILLEEKWRVQKELAKISGYDLMKYAAMIDRIVEETAKKFKHTIKKKKHNK